MTTPTQWTAPDDLIATAKARAAEAVGAPFEIRFPSRGYSFAGTIVRCEFKGLRRRTSSVIAQFSVTLEGPTGRRETGTVERIPTGGARW